MVVNKRHACHVLRIFTIETTLFTMNKKNIFPRAEGDGESEVRVPSKKKREQEAAARKLQEEEQEPEPPSKTPPASRATSPSSTVVSTEAEGDEEEEKPRAKPVASSRYKRFDNFDHI